MSPATCRHFSVAAEQLAVYAGGVVTLLAWQGVDVMSEDSKKVYILVERTGSLTRGVSRALWPASVRRVVATGKAAQRRRARLMRRQRRRLRVRVTGHLAERVRGRIRERVATLLAALSPRLFLPALVACSMLCGGALVLALVWQVWYLPALALLPLLLLSCSPALRRPMGLPPVPLSQQTILDTAPIPPSFPWKSLPGQIGSPETPMPDPPSLVRVLETFDLSRAESESALPSPSTPPHQSATSSSGQRDHSDQDGEAYEATHERH